MAPRTSGTGNHAARVCDMHAVVTNPVPQPCLLRGKLMIGHVPTVLDWMAEP